MPLFDYKGISGSDNKYAEGSINAINEDEASFKLREQKIIITSLSLSKGQKINKVKESSTSISFFSSGKIKSKEIALFTKKLSTMIRAGLQVLDALQMTYEQMKNKKLKNIINEILTDLQGGVDLSGCFSKHSKTFDNIYANMIRAGEASGKLDIFLDKLVMILEKREKTKEKRLLYPLWRAVNTVSRENLMTTVFDYKFVTSCVAGRKLLVISETGEVQPCEILGKSIGNLRNHDWDLTKLLKENSVNQMQKWIKDTKCKCSFECALAANVVWKPKNYPKVVSAAIKNIGKSMVDHSK